MNLVPREKVESQTTSRGSRSKPILIITNLRLIVPPLETSGDVQIVWITLEKLLGNE